MFRPRTTRVQSAVPNRKQESIMKPLTTQNLMMLEEQ